MELIDRNETIKAIQNDCLESVYYTKQDAIDCIAGIPAADAVPGVRCGECQYYSGKYCTGLCAEQSFKMESTDYCRYGEPRTPPAE